MPFEECDDGNTTNGDGCSSDCKVEEGFACVREGVACLTVCGDGLLRGLEECDDGNAASPGCSAECRLEPGYKCEIPGQPCEATVCGDGVKEGTEQCDDTQPGQIDKPFDGCYKCVQETQCMPGAGCTAVCGDGLVFPGEECDDGNTRDGDGCSSSCKAEPGYTCTIATEDLPSELVLPVLYRDFKSPFKPLEGNRTRGEDNADLDPTGHPDFEFFVNRNGNNPYLNLVNVMLGNDGKPVYNVATGGAVGGVRQITSQATFNEWFHDGTRDAPVVTTLTLPRVASSDVYRFDSREVVAFQGECPGSNCGARFFPLHPGVPGFAGEGHGIPDGKVCRSNYVDPANNSATHTGMFCTGPNETTKRNLHFTTELHFWFTYDANTEPTLTFSGDDDVWIFINGQRVIDLGGMHARLERSYTITPANAAELGLQADHIYDIALFHAERHATASNFMFTLSGFLRKTSTCVTECGDGVKTPDEACDDGAQNNTGGYNKCNADCSWGPRCGDGVVQPEFEQCDDGNLTYDDGCNPDCRFPAGTIVN